MPLPGGMYLHEGFLLQLTLLFSPFFIFNHVSLKNTFNDFGTEAERSLPESTFTDAVIAEAEISWRWR